jgi:RNA polymerase sigma-70 factor (ECF subfamily)
MAPDPRQLSERVRSLLAAARRGDSESFGQLLEAYRSYLLAVASAEIETAARPKAASSDIVQETFLEAHRLFSRFEGNDAEVFRAWLRGILINKLNKLHERYFNVQKRQVRRERSLDDSDDGPLRDVLPAAEAPPSSEAIRNEEARLVGRALKRLPEAQRNVLVWRHWEGATFAEMGRRLGRSEDAARMLYGRAMERLQEEIGRDRDR